MRTRNSFLNVVSNCVCYIVLMLSGFIIRKTFAEVLGLECVGIDGRFTDYVHLITILELNLGMSLVYKLYDPIVKQDWSRISTILRFLRNSYIIISMSIITFGLVFSIFAVNSITENISKEWLFRIFFLYLIDITSSYYYYHKRMMIIADQYSRVIGIIRICCLVVMSIFQFFGLKIFKSFELYLLIKIASKMSENICISRIFNKKYNMIDLKSKLKLVAEQKKEILKNVKAMLFHKIGGTSLNQISTLIFGLISLPLSENGIYCNYMIIILALWGISREFFSGVMASFGNLLNTEKGEKVEKNLNVIFLINFFIYSFFCSSFFCVSAPFMKFWITSGNSVFGLSTTIALTVYLYVYGMRQSLEMARSSAGIYVQDRYVPLIECLINFVVSYFLARRMGINGAIIGNIISFICTTFITYPFFVYKIILGKNPKDYYKKYCLYTVLTLSESYLCYYLTNSFTLSSNFLQIIANFILCLIISNGINIIAFCKTQEFIHMRSLFSRIFLRFKKINSSV